MSTYLLSFHYRILQNKTSTISHKLFLFVLVFFNAQPALHAKQLSRMLLKHTHNLWPKPAALVNSHFLKYLITILFLFLKYSPSSLYFSFLPHALQALTVSTEDLFHLFDYLLHIISLYGLSESSFTCLTEELLQLLALFLISLDSNRENL